MKLESVVIITKGACLTAIPTLSVIGGGIDTLGLQVVFGVPVCLIKLLCAAGAAGAGGLLAFISQSFGDFMQKRIPTGDTNVWTRQPGAITPIPGTTSAPVQSTSTPKP